MPNTRSCSTYTTQSIRCMLSRAGEHARPRVTEEILPNYLQRNGVEVIWRSNNWGEPTLHVSSRLSGDDLLALRDGPGRLKCAASLLFMAATLGISALTWHGAYSLFPAVGSLVGTFAMFWLRGTRLRWAMVLVNGLWLVNAVAYAAWWQIAANGLSGGAAAFGAWRGRRD